LKYIEAVPTGGPTRTAGTLVLLHAFPLDGRMWEKQMALAASGWRVIAPHWRGAYEDPRLPAASVDEYAADVIDLLDDLHVDNAVVTGLSMGGYVAFAMFRRAERYFRGLVLADTRAPADTPEEIEGRKRLQNTARDQGVAGVADQMLPRLLGATTKKQRPHVVDEVRAIILSQPLPAVEAELRSIMERPDSTDTLKRVKCPTLVIVGEEDVITPLDLSRKINAGITGSELVVLPLAGHLSNLETPDAFNAVLAQFLDHRV
jgi:pimeloyl-ACP methyl ester carboxylesterase